MIRSSWRIGTVVAGLLVLASLVPATAGELVPFHGTDSGTVHVIGQPSPTVFVTQNISSGEGTLVGAYTLEGTEQLDVSMRQTTGVVTISQGGAVLTAANGDQIFLSYSGQATVGANGLLTSTFPATVTGGTGRFAGATGTLIFSSVGSLGGQFTETINGEFSSPGSSGH